MKERWAATRVRYSGFFSFSPLLSSFLALCSRREHARARRTNERAWTGRVRELKPAGSLFLGHTRGYDAIHPSTTTPAQRLKTGNATHGGELGSFRAGARPRSAALGRVRRASCPNRSIDRLAAPAWPLRRRGWVGHGAAHGRVPGLIRRAASRHATSGGDGDDDNATLRFPASFSFPFLFLSLPAPYIPFDPHSLQSPGKPPLFLSSAM